MVPLPRGPLTGMVTSALPELPFNEMLPETSNPGLSGVPSVSATSGLRSACATACRTTSELRKAANTTPTIPATNRTHKRKIVPQPTGTNHFQLRDHQFCGCDDEVTTGDW